MHNSRNTTNIQVLPKILTVPVDLQILIFSSYISSISQNVVGVHAGSHTKMF